MGYRMSAGRWAMTNYLDVRAPSCASSPGCSAKPRSPGREHRSQARPKRGRARPGEGDGRSQPAKAQLSDEPVLTLTIDYEEGVTVQKPPFGGSLGGFIIRDFREPPPKINDGREVIQQIYTLEPTETGKLLIDPISVTFTDNRPNGDGRTHTIETESLTVEITSIVGDKAPSLGELRPSAEPIELPSSTSPWLWGLAVAGVAALAIAWWLIRRRRREKAVAAAILTPEELAIRELDALERSGLAERDIKLFYVELTGIVRRYIEQTTGIRAPEQTTEEFLREISRGATIWESAGSTATQRGTNGTNGVAVQLPLQRERRFHEDHLRG